MGWPALTFTKRYLPVAIGMCLSTSVSVAAEIQFHLDKRRSDQPVGMAEAARVISNGEEYKINIKLEEAASSRLAELTRKHVGEWIYLRVGSKVLFSGRIQAPIETPEFEIQGAFSKQEAEEIVMELLAK